MQFAIHGRRVPVTDRLIALAGRRLSYALGRLTHAIERVSLRIDDINGPKGGIDTEILALVELRPRGSFVVRGRYLNPAVGISDVLDRIRDHVTRQRERLADLALARAR